MNVIDIIEEAAGNIAPVGVIYEVTALSGTSWRLRVSDTFYVMRKRTITIDAVAYTVIGFVSDTSIDVQGTTIPAATSFSLDPPAFCHGTYVMATHEVDVEDNTPDPLIYLVEPFSTGIPGGNLSPFGDVANVRLLFLGSFDGDAGWTTDQHYDEVVTPMENLRRLLKKQLNRSKNLGNILEDGQKFNHVIAGANPIDETKDKQLFGQNYSGVEYVVRLPVFKPVCEY